MLYWTSDYLTVRKQRVLIKFISIRWVLYLVGVPRGISPGDTYVLIYVKDISDNLLSLTRLLANDSFTSGSLSDTECIINHDHHFVMGKHMAGNFQSK